MPKLTDYLGTLAVNHNYFAHLIEKANLPTDEKIVRIVRAENAMLAEINQLLKTS